MTNVQLLLSIGIPSLLIVLSSLNSNQRFLRLEAGQDALGKRIDSLQDSVDKRFTALQDSVDQRFSALQDSFGKRLEDARRDSHKDALEIMRSMTALHERVAVVESKQGLSSIS